MAHRSFTSFVQKARGARPYRYQSRLADHGLPDVLRVPTGTGKTLAATLPWLYRRVEHPDPVVRRATPRWLVIVLPQRALVEQTVRVVEGWLGKLGLEVPVHVLMGGEDRGDGEWKAHPERERIFVGTLDMVLSRLLMRGFAEFRSAWPMSFGLLHAGVQFVFDEVQLMGPGLPTALQLQGLREAMGTALECRSMWMSATLDPAALSTMDFRRELSIVELDEQDRAGPLRVRLAAPRTVRRLDLGDVDARRYPRALAERIVAHHRPGTRTLVVLNTVQRATTVFDEVAELAPEADPLLLHSRFRPSDRQRQARRVEEAPGDAGSIVVATQVLEAGVDLTSETLITEVAPWSSIVQRAGRCNRDGLASDARLLWCVPPAALPYEAAELDHTVSVLAGRNGQVVTSTELAAAATELTRPMHPVLRRRDLLGLFDTAPDLSGNDIDVSPFIRDAADHTVFVAWRELPDDQVEGGAPGRAELCPAPIGDVREMIKEGFTRARVFDQRSGRWEPARPDDVRPTAVIVLDAARGGYLPDRGFAPRSTAPVEPVAPPDQVPDAVDTDPHSVLPNGRWVPLPEHLADVERECRALLHALDPQLSPGQREAVALAGRYHDLGKAHPTFVESLARADDSAPEEGGPWAKSPGRTPLRHSPPHFRHELVSALLLLDDTTGLLDGVAEPDLVIYLALAHHGKVRLTVRARPDEPQGTILGVVDKSSTVNTALPVTGLLTARPVSLRATRFGQGSLTSRALRLRDRADLGPFRLAFCEAVVRSADWRASASYEGTTS
ncbi:MAG: CRISPR-associated helicase Cas3' [Actinomycetota bacterium]|nr:CRISPR-associated helicase Cas3' [Actinomycetota bacterium]